MMVYQNEIIIRIWNGDPGHASCAIRSIEPPGSVRQTNISWFPADDDLNNRKKDRWGAFQMRTAAPTTSYRADARWETAGGVQNLYKRKEAWNVAKRMVDEFEDEINRAKHLVSVADEDIQDKAFEKLRNDLEDGRSTCTDDMKQHWDYVKKYLEPYMLVWQRKLTLQGNARKGYPTIQLEKNDFELRPNQKVKENEVITVAALKDSIPGMYSALQPCRISNGQVTAKVILPDILNEIHQFIPAGAHAYWGLNLSAVAIAWAEFLRNPRNGYQYASTTNNCAGVVHQMLVAGGVDAFVKTPSAMIWRDPDDIRRLSDSLINRLLELNRATLAFKQAMRATGLYDQVNLDQQDLWLLNTFMRQSSVGKVFAIRKEQVRNIDANLRIYHSLVWSPANFVKKYEALVNMFDNILDHRQRKPRSDRRVGVDSLGVQILKLIETDLPTRIHRPLPERIADANNVLSQNSKRQGVRVKK